MYFHIQPKKFDSHQESNIIQINKGNFCRWIKKEWTYAHRLNQVHFKRITWVYVQFTFIKRAKGRMSFLIQTNNKRNMELLTGCVFFLLSSLKTHSFINAMAHILFQYRSRITIIIHRSGCDNRTRFIHH